MRNGYMVWAFTLGAAVGSVVTWQYLKKKYENDLQDADDMSDETMEVCETETYQEYVDDVREKANIAKTKPDISAFTNRFPQQAYAAYNDTVSSYTQDFETDDGQEREGPYIISPDEFGEKDEYEQISLTYFADFVVADENDEVVEDVDTIIGAEALNSFGQYEDDAVFVRNDLLKCDYEILKDRRKYANVAKRKPHEVD